MNELRVTIEINKVSWDAERLALTSSLEAQRRERTSAEEDRDFFKEQYAQASGYVASVRAQNDELEKQAQISERRAVEGVRLVRETFTERVKQLEAEIQQKRNLCDLLIERDKRTGDEIRRRAGEEPGLRTRCAELETQIERLNIVNEALTLDLLRLEDEKVVWENARMTPEEEIKENGTDATPDEEVDQQDDVDMVHRCQWKIDGTTSCDSLFGDVEVCKRFGCIR